MPWALCTAILDWSLREVLGFSAFISVGSMLDVGWGDLIEYLGEDPHTESIVIYMESIGDARSFLRAARDVAQRKPIIVIKAGRTEAAAKAAQSHTGSMTGSDAVLDAAFRRAGVLRVDSIGDLFHLAEVLSKQPHPKGRRLAIVTNAGGPGVLAADALMTGGGELAQLSAATLRGLDAILPAHWSHGNPIDVLADATEATFERAIQLALSDEGTDGVLAITAPLVTAQPLVMAKNIAKFARQGKPVIASFMGGDEVTAADQLMSQGRIPTFDFPDDAAHVFNYMWKYSDTLQTLAETLPRDGVGQDATVGVHMSESPRAQAIINTARQANRLLLTEVESKQILASYGIPVVETIEARNADEAVESARKIGFPVVVKLLSKTITHKSDIGGVRLDLKSDEDVRKAFLEIQRNVVEHYGISDFDGVSVQRMVPPGGIELILGSTMDEQFGPVLLFGAGGIFTEVMKDRALGLPPLTKPLAHSMMQQTIIWKALQGIRGGSAVDIPSLENALVSLSQLVLNEPWIKEIDINPLLATPNGSLALDARIVLYARRLSPKIFRYPVWQV